MNNNPTRCLVFTGGHHTSALALAQKLQSDGWRIFWIGHKFSQWQDKSVSAEFREVRAADIDFYDLKAGKIYHTYHPLKLFRLPVGFISAFIYLLRLKIKYRTGLKGIVTFGGYLGVPVVFSGWLLGIPVIAHEQTVTAGWANRFIALFAKKIALTWSQSQNHYPRRKSVVTGLPIRPEIIKNLKSKNAGHIIPARIYITGGKQGSHVINLAVFSVLTELLRIYTVIHQTGSSSAFNDYQEAIRLQKLLPDNLKSSYQIYNYLDSSLVAGVLTEADVVVSRSGAHIIHELALFGCKCVLIPIPWSSHDEQNKNARLLVQNHQAVILPQSQLTGSNLLQAITSAKQLKPEAMHLNLNGMENMLQLIEQTFA